jgi:hypothetical protein
MNGNRYTVEQVVARLSLGDVICMFRFSVGSSPRLPSDAALRHHYRAPGALVPADVIEPGNGSSKTAGIRTRFLLVGKLFLVTKAAGCYPAIIQLRFNLPFLIRRSLGQRVTPGRGI